MPFFATRQDAVLLTAFLTITNAASANDNHRLTDNDLNESRMISTMINRGMTHGLDILTGQNIVKGNFLDDYFDTRYYLNMNLLF